MWYCYMLECLDGSIYTGIARDVDARMVRHVEGRGSRYVQSRGFGQLLAYREFKNHRTAAREEARIKRLTRVRKLALVDLWRERYHGGAE